MAHGLGGGGYNSYLPCINYLAQNGYYVFAYDATGNDNSEGKGVGGLPQGISDLSSAIDFISAEDEYSGLPIVLFGHSWGGYSVTNVLKYHPEVKAAVSISGFDSSYDLLYSQGISAAGKAAEAVLPFMKLIERIKYPEYSDCSALDSFENSTAAVMVIHSEDDKTVPKKYGYDKWFERYGNDPRFTFISYTDRGHSEIYYSREAVKYTADFNNTYQKWADSLPNKVTDEEHADYVNKNLDREIWRNVIDTELFERIVEFYDNNI